MLSQSDERFGAAIRGGEIALASHGDREWRIGSLRVTVKR